MSPEERATALGRRGWAASMREDSSPLVAEPVEVQEFLDALARRQVVDAEPWRPAPFQLEIYGIPVVRPDGRAYVIHFPAGLPRAEMLEEEHGTAG
jgi:hypothetical protein